MHYEPTREPHHFMGRFRLASPPQQPPRVHPGDTGLFIRRPRGGRPIGDTSDEALDALRVEAVLGHWGLLRGAPPPGSSTPPSLYEAPGETAAATPEFGGPWRRGHRCVVLADAVWRDGETEGSIVRVSRPDGEPLALAGLWHGWRLPDGECLESFALLTLPAEDHPMQRRIVFLRDAWIDDWLQCPVEETTAYLRPYVLDRLVRQTLAVDDAPLPAIGASPRA